MKTQILLFLYRVLLKSLLIAITVCYLTGCSKERGVYNEPSYGRLNIAFNSVNQDALFDVYVDGKLKSDSLRSFGDWLEVGKRRLQLSRLGSTVFFLDTLMEIEQPKRISLTVIDLDPSKQPMLLPPDFFQTTPPAPGYVKYRLLNVDETHFKNRVIDIDFYLIGDEMTYIGELKNVQPNVPTSYIELPLNSGIVMEIKDNVTGEILIAKETYGGGILNPYDDGNNVYLAKYYNTITDSTVGYDFYSAEVLAGAKL
jgi:hypothetical protein